MKLNTRRATLEDASVLGQINYDAFKKIADDHNFPPDFPSAEYAVGTVTALTSNPGIYSVVAEVEGKIAGSNFMDERNPIAGIGPISVDPSVQNQSIGRHLMDNVTRRRDEGAQLSRRRTPGSDRISQPFAMPVYQARLRNARAAFGNAGQAAEPDDCPRYAVRRATEGRPRRSCNALVRARSRASLRWR